MVFPPASAGSNMHSSQYLPGLADIAENINTSADKEAYMQQLASCTASDFEQSTGSKYVHTRPHLQTQRHASKLTYLKGPLVNFVPDHRLKQASGTITNKT